MSKEPGPQSSEVEEEVNASEANIYSQSNKFGLFVLLVSFVVFLIPIFVPSVAPNGWEIIAWMGWAIGLFILGIIIIVMTYLLKAIFRPE